MSGRIRFANQLRGIAALSVAASHLIGVFWLLPGVVDSVTFSPTPAGSPPPVLLGLVSHTWFNFGPFGVAVFFLISGFVIPFSLERHSRLSFAAARLLRIYPTYVAAFLLQMAVVYVASRVWDRPFTHSPWIILSNALLVYDLIGDSSLDLVNWTLSVELKFYLLMLLLAPMIRAGRIAAVLAAGLALLLLNAIIHAAGLQGAAPSTVAHTLSSHAVCLGYMLIGTAFNLHLRRAISRPVLVASVAALVAAFLVSWHLGVWGVPYPLAVPVVVANYLYALAAFAALYAGRRFIPANAVLDAMAAISFPFYLVHSLIGYSTLRALMIGLSVPYAIALPLTLLVLLAVSALLHWAVERPSVRAGQWLARSRGAPAGGVGGGAGGTVAKGSRIILP